MFKLIRDKIPELAKADGKILNYAAAENKELYIALLREKFIEEAQEFLNSGTVEEAIDVVTVLYAAVKALGVSKEDFDKAYEEKLEKNGGFDKQYIGFFPDPRPQSAQQPEPEPEPQPEEKK